MSAAGESRDIDAMTDAPTMAAMRLKARIAGLLYLVVIAGGVLALSANSAAIVRSDAAVTAARVMTSEGLYRLAFAANVVAGLCNIGIAAILYELLRPVSRTGSLFAAFLNVAGSAAGAAHSVLLFAPLLFLRGTAYLEAFNADQLQALALTLARLSAVGTNVTLVLFGAGTLTIGVLAWRSGFMPKALGAVLMLAGSVWVANSLVGFVAPDFVNSLAPWPMAVAGLGEGFFAVWLLVGSMDAGAVAARSRFSEEDLAGEA